jgi:hypothetical protein
LSAEAKEGEEPEDVEEDEKVRELLDKRPAKCTIRI